LQRFITLSGYTTLVILKRMLMNRMTFNSEGILRTVTWVNWEATLPQLRRPERTRGETGLRLTCGSNTSVTSRVVQLNNTSRYLSSMYHIISHRAYIKLAVTVRRSTCGSTSVHVR
jgi:hypothetical protein